LGEIPLAWKKTAHWKWLRYFLALIIVGVAAGLRAVRAVEPESNMELK
jgi:hypothetical protein